MNQTLENWKILKYRAKNKVERIYQWVYELSIY